MRLGFSTHENKVKSKFRINNIFLSNSWLLETCKGFTFKPSFISEFFFKKSSGSGATHTLFWTSGDVSPGFQSQSGQSYLHLAEVYMLHIP